jgi:hypothetical protein
VNVKVGEELSHFSSFQTVKFTRQMSEFFTHCPFSPFLSLEDKSLFPMIPSGFHCDFERFPLAHLLLNVTITIIYYKVGAGDMRLTFVPQSKSHRRTVDLWLPDALVRNWQVAHQRYRGRHQEWERLSRLEAPALVLESVVLDLANEEKAELSLRRHLWRFVNAQLPPELRGQDGTLAELPACRQQDALKPEKDA